MSEGKQEQKSVSKHQYCQSLGLKTHRPQRLSLYLIHQDVTHHAHFVLITHGHIIYQDETNLYLTRADNL